MKLHKAKTKLGKRICGAISGTSLIGMIGLVGSMEWDKIGLLEGIALLPLLVIGFAWGAWAAGVMDEGGETENADTNSVRGEPGSMYRDAAAGPRSIQL